jgi:hypothetical protein
MIKLQHLEVYPNDLVQYEHNGKTYEYNYDELTSELISHINSLDNLIICIVY